MKKLGLAVAVATALGATSAVVNAYTIGQYANGLLVPYASFQSEAEGTAVGLMSNCPGMVYWTFFDVNTKHVTDGKFHMTKNDMYSFIWSKEAGIGLEGEQGYLLFLLDEDEDPTKPNTGDEYIDESDCAYESYGGVRVGGLAGSAFYVDLNANDVQFVPTAPVAFHDLGHGDGLEPSDLQFLENDDLTALAAGAQEYDYVDMRYFIDNETGGDDTTIVLWSVCKPPVTNTVLMYNDNQANKSVNFPLPNDELNVIDPETIRGRPEGYIDGFIRWQVSAADTPSSGDDSGYCDHNGTDYDDDQAVLSYSIISSPTFGAVQTLTNPHDWFHDVD